ncbi:type II secretion system protein J [Yoonia sp. BS5-3]|uniref:Type II secretion system protein J n=1 Tax=Yoonia phaeophyticola TaxID=3137369 RepID=A0ABZ2V667_9RHOB
MRRRASHKGFTLIETLVSLSIATLAITGFYQALSTGLFMERRAGMQAEQMLVATRIMDQIGVDLAVQPGMQDSGMIRDMEWSMVVSEAGTSDMRLGPVQPGELVFIYVTVQPPLDDGSPVTLRAIRYRETPL